MSNIANEIASTLQTAHLNTAPDPAHDANPSTAASEKTPVLVDAPTSQTSSSSSIDAAALSQGERRRHQSHHHHHHNHGHSSRRVHITTSASSAHHEPSLTTEPDTIPLSILRPVPRNRPNQPPLPPLPDLRFEQSYLARIAPYTSSLSSSSSATGNTRAKNENYHAYLMIAYVTLLDHVLMPLSQGIVWNLAVFGWRSWNRGVKFRGRGVGARVRRWWWGVNGWKLPGGAEG